MSFIISSGYAEIQILKTSESDPLSFWNILICICPNSEKSKTEKDIICKNSADTLRYHIFVCNIGSAILHFCVTLDLGSHLNFNCFNFLNHILGGELD